MPRPKGSANKKPGPRSFINIFTGALKAKNIKTVCECYYKMKHFSDRKKKAIEKQLSVPFFTQIINDKQNITRQKEDSAKTFVTPIPTRIFYNPSSQSIITPEKKI